MACKSLQVGDFFVYGISNKDKKIANTRKRLGAIVETPSVYLGLTAKENLVEQFKLVGNPDFSEINELLKLVNLENTENKKVKNFSLRNEAKIRNCYDFSLSSRFYNFGRTNKWSRSRGNY